MFVHLPDFCTTLKPCLKPCPGDLFPHLGTAWWPTSSSKSRPIPSSEGQQRKEMQPSVLASHCHHWPVLVQIQPQTSTNYREMEKPTPSASLRELPMGRRLHQLAGLTSTTPPQFKALNSKPLPCCAISPAPGLPPRPTTFSGLPSLSLTRTGVNLQMPGASRPYLGNRRIQANRPALPDLYWPVTPAQYNLSLLRLLPAWPSLSQIFKGSPWWAAWHAVLYRLPRILLL